MKFKVTSEIGLAEAFFGEVIDSSDLIGCNIQALLDGGHIAVVETKVKSEGKSETTED